MVNFHGKTSIHVKVLQLPAKFQTAMVSFGLQIPVTTGGFELQTLAYKVVT